MFFSKLFSQKEVSFENPEDQRLYDRAVSHMESCEETYLELLGLQKTKLKPLGLFRLRLFAINFSVSAMTLAWGKEQNSRSERIYKQLYLRSLYRIKVSRSLAENVSKTVLKEQTRALIAEKNNVGSGQYALGTLYEEAVFAESKSRDSEAEKILVTHMGKIIGENLAEWADLYSELSNQAMQTYTAGFKPTTKDAQRLGE